MADAKRSRSHARLRYSGGNSSTGLAIDSSGRPAYDPSENVLQLTNAAVERIDDMAELRALLVDAQLKSVEREWINQEKLAIIRSEHNKEIRHLESDRLDKIRSVDVANAAATAAQLLSAVQTLATTAAGTAETLRNQVTATATAVANQTERIINPIIERVGLLEKSQYMITGRTAVTDPALSELITEMRAVRQAQAQGAGKTEGISWVGALILGAFAVLGVLVGIVGAIMAFVRP